MSFGISPGAERSFASRAPMCTVEWTKVGGPGTVTCGDPSNEVTSATFSQSGIYVLRLMASDGSLTGSDDLLVTVDAPPVVSAGPNQTNTLPASITLSGSVSDDGIPTNGVLTVNWSAMSGPGPVVVWLKLEGRLNQKTPKPPHPMPEQIARLRQALGVTG